MINWQEFLGEIREKFAFKAYRFNNWPFFNFSDLTFTLSKPLSVCISKLIDLGDEIIWREIWNE